MNTSSSFCLRCLVSACAFIAVARSASAQMFYGLTFFDNQVISVDGSGTGSLSGTLGQNVMGYGLAYNGSRLFTFDPNTDRIREINPGTAALGASYNIGVGNLLGEGDLAFRADGMGFLSSALSPNFSPSNDLFRFDLVAGTSTRIGSTSLALNGLAFLGNTLYAIGKEGSPSLYIVNQTTGALSVVGSLGLTEGSPIGALTSDMNGHLYGVVDDRLYMINAMTGHADAVSTSVLDLGFASVSGLAFVPTAMTAVPEPSTYGAVGAVILVGAAFLRRRKNARNEARS